MKASIHRQYGQLASKDVKFGFTVVRVILLMAVLVLVVGFEAEGEESLLSQQYNLGKEEAA